MFYLVFLALVMYFAPPYFVKFLSYQLNIPFTPTSRMWRIAALVAVVSAIIIHGIFYNTVSNFILHALGGGVVSSLLYFYVKLSLNIKLNWKLDILALFAFVSALGSLNEIAEYMLDTLQLSQFSLDRKDTWRDIVANTSGAVMGWIGVNLLMKK